MAPNASPSRSQQRTSPKGKAPLDPGSGAQRHLGIFPLGGVRSSRRSSGDSCQAEVRKEKKGLDRRDSQTSRGEDQHPKRVKGEEKLEMLHPNQKEAISNKLPGDVGENGLHPAAPGKSRLEPPQPDSGAANDKGLLMGPRVDCGSSTPAALGSCRPQVGEMSQWCLECGKAFGQKTELEKHRLLNHAGQCSYVCRDCGRGLTDHVARPPLQGVCTAGNSHSHAGCGRRGLPLSSETGMQRKERKELSLQEKVRVLEMLEGPKVSQSELAKRFGVSQPQICRIIKNKERILAEWRKSANPGRKRRREDKTTSSSSSSCAVLLQWFEQSRVGSVPPADGTRRQDGAKGPPETVGKPELGVGLRSVTGFKARRKVRPLAEKQNGEPLEEGHWERTVLPSLLRNYDPPDIYACGEAGILFRATPEGLALADGEEAKDQLTVLLCTNLDASDKRDALMVGKREKPFGFQGVGATEFPVTYRANSRAWMTTALFTEWLQTFNEDMKQQQRRVVLFLAQCGVHPHAELSNVEMVFMPASPSRIHPLEQGVIQNFKSHYRRRMLTRLLVVRNSNASASTSTLSKHLTLLDALHVVVQAWSEVSPQTVTDGFRAAGFGLSPCVPAPPADVVQALGFRNREQFEQFVLVDEGLECLGDPEGGKETPQCPEPVCAAGEEDEKAADVGLLSCPSEAEVLESLAKLRRYLECHSVSPTVFQTFYQLEDMVYGMSLVKMQALRATAHNKD